MKGKKIIKNARIYTASASSPWAEAALIEDGKFTCVGSEKDVMTEADDADFINLGGRLVLPGLIDAHTHIGLSVMMDGDGDSMPMWDCKSKEEILATLKTHVRKHPFSLYYTAFFGQVEALAGGLLTKEDLDRVVKHRPVVLLEQECHSAWLNSAAMKLLKLGDDIEDPAPGYSCYERDEKGRLTGCIKEMTMLPLLAMTGRISKKNMKSGILKICNYLVEHGVTTVYDAGNYFKEEDTYKLLSEMDRKGELPIRMEGSYIITHPDMAENAVDEIKRYRELYETEHLKFNTVKIMFDGTHRIHTAKLVKPYNDVNTTGGTMLPEDKLYELVSRLNKEGVSFHAHTVGEGASRMILDCAERVKKEQGGLNINITMAHLESQRDEDIPRFSDPNLFANFTPHWHGGNDYGTNEENIHLLGSKRGMQIFRVKTMLDHGANVTFSSDEVTLQLLDRWNPFLGMEIGHTRQEVNDGGKDAPVFPPEEERLSIEELVKGYTITAARQLGLDDRIGSIEAGKSADFMVLNEDLFKMDSYEIHNIRPKAVVVEGKTVQGDSNQTDQ